MKRNILDIDDVIKMIKVIIMNKKLEKKQLPCQISILLNRLKLLKF